MTKSHGALVVLIAATWLSAPALAKEEPRYAPPASWVAAPNAPLPPLTAAARDNPAVAGLYQQAGAPVLRLIEGAVRLCEKIGKPIGICGDMAGEVSQIAALLRAGLRQFSLAPSRLFAIRALVGGLNADGSQIRSSVNGA